MNIHNDPEDIEHLEAIELCKRPVTMALRASGGTGDREPAQFSI